MVFYIHVCYIQNLSLLRDKTPQKVESGRLRLSLKLWLSAFAHDVIFSCVLSFYFFCRTPASVRQDLDFHWGSVRAE